MTLGVQLIACIYWSSELNSRDQYDQLDPFKVRKQTTDKSWLPACNFFWLHYKYKYVSMRHDIPRPVSAPMSSFVKCCS